jgi:hypothetical protein
MKNRDSQRKMVLNHLIENKSITSIEAINLYACTRLSAIIYNLREDGLQIETEMCVGKNRFGNPTNFAKYILKND